MKNPKLDFYYKNIVPIPHLLTKTFMSLPNTEPYAVAKAFFKQYDSCLNEQPISKHQPEPGLGKDIVAEDKSTSDSNNDVSQSSQTPPSNATLLEFLQDFLMLFRSVTYVPKGKYHWYCTP
jgi:hypothetical protein